MEQYRKTIRIRSIVLSIGIIACVAILLISRELGRGVRDFRLDFIAGVQMGLVLAFEIVFIYRDIMYRKALKDEKVFEKLYIEENDERKTFIDRKMSTMTFNISLSMLVLATVVSGFFNTTVFFTLFGVLAFISFTKIILKFYYNNKY